MGFAWSMVAGVGVGWLWGSVADGLGLGLAGFKPGQPSNSSWYGLSSDFASGDVRGEAGEEIGGESNFETGING
jgi:hypothetical protein